MTPEMARQVSSQSLYRVICSATFGVGGVVAYEAGRYCRNEGVHGKRFVDDALGEVDARYFAQLPALVEREVVEAAPDVPAFHEVASCLRQVQHQVFVVALGRCLPSDALLRLHGGVVEVFEVGHVLKRAVSKPPLALACPLGFAARAAGGLALFRVHRGTPHGSQWLVRTAA